MICMIHRKGSEEGVGTFSRGQLILIISQNSQLYQNDTLAVEYRFNEVLGIQLASSLNKRLQHRHFTVSISKFSRTAIVKNTTE